MYVVIDDRTGKRVSIPADIRVSQGVALYMASITGKAYRIIYVGKGE